MFEAAAVRFAWTLSRWMFAGIAVSALAITSVGAAQTVPAPPQVGGSTKTIATDAQPGPKESAAKQGVKVSGWWTIQVKDRDGKVTERRDFENALQNSELLPALLLNLFTAGQPVVQFDGGTLKCGTNSPTCLMTMVSAPAKFFPCISSEGCETNLTATPHYTPNANGGHADGLTLAGSIAVTNTGNIIFVATDWRFCAHGEDLAASSGVKSVTTPAACAAETPMGTDTIRTSGFTNFIFTGGGNLTPIHVNAGQIVQVSVLLTFS